MFRLSGNVDPNCYETLAEFGGRRETIYQPMLWVFLFEKCWGMLAASVERPARRKVFVGACVVEFVAASSALPGSIVAPNSRTCNLEGEPQAAHHNPDQATLGRTRSTLGGKVQHPSPELGPESSRPNSGRIRAMLGPTSINFARIWPGVCQSWPGIDQVWPDLA